MLQCSNKAVDEGFAQEPNAYISRNNKAFLGISASRYRSYKCYGLLNTTSAVANGYKPGL